jgi:hypothetical protein
MSSVSVEKRPVVRRSRSEVTVYFVARSLT